MVSTDALFHIGDTAEEEVNYDLARQWFKRGASLGDTECLSRLANMFEVGLGGQPAKGRAMQLYK
jgi:TPR repeat protein